jgi:glutaredoxin
MIVVWSKDNCKFCEAAFELLNRYNLSYEIRKLGEGWTKEELLE